MKTLFMWDYFGRTKFFELEGDHSHLDGVYINGYYSENTHERQKALNDLIYDVDGNRKVKLLENPTKDWDHFVRCGID